MKSILDAVQLDRVSMSTRTRSSISSQADNGLWWVRFEARRAEEKKEIFNGGDDGGGGRSQQCNQMLRKGHKILCLLDDRPSQSDYLAIFSPVSLRAAEDMLVWWIFSSAKKNSINSSIVLHCLLGPEIASEKEKKSTRRRKETCHRFPETIHTHIDHDFAGWFSFVWEFLSLSPSQSRRVVLYAAVCYLDFLSRRFLATIVRFFLCLYHAHDNLHLINTPASPSAASRKKKVYSRLGFFTSRGWNSKLIWSKAIDEASPKRETKTKICVKVSNVDRAIWISWSS